MTIEFAKITQRRRVCRVETMRKTVETFGFYISGLHLSHQTAPHGALDACALACIEDRRGGDAGGFVNAEFLQLLRRFLSLLRKHALLLENGAKDLNRSLI